MFSSTYFSITVLLCSVTRVTSQRRQLLLNTLWGEISILNCLVTTTYLHAVCACCARLRVHMSVPMHKKKKKIQVSLSVVLDVMRSLGGFNPICTSSLCLSLSLSLTLPSLSVITMSPAFCLSSCSPITANEESQWQCLPARPSERIQWINNEILTQTKGCECPSSGIMRNLWLILISASVCVCCACVSCMSGVEEVFRSFIQVTEQGENAFWAATKFFTPILQMTTGSDRSQ